MMVGTSPDHQKLQLFDNSTNTMVCDLNGDENQSLESICSSRGIGLTDRRFRIHASEGPPSSRFLFPFLLLESLPHPYIFLKIIRSRSLEINHPLLPQVVDTDPNKTVAKLQDLSQVEKYTISEESYNQRDDTFRKWKQANLPQAASANSAAQSEASGEEEQQRAAGMKVGDRCEAEIEGVGKKRGQIKFIGTTSFAEGVMIGIQLDEPYGKNDGSVKSKRYFSCPEKYGKFLRPSQVTVGDFPEQLDWELDDEI